MGLIRAYRFSHLATLRSQRVGTQRDIRRLSKLANDTIDKIETGAPVFLSSLARYCDALELEVDDLLSEANPLTISVSRGISFRPSAAPDAANHRWHRSATVIVISNLVLRASAAVLHPVFVEKVSLSSDHLGQIFQEPMSWTYWVSVDNANDGVVLSRDAAWLGLVSRDGGATIKGLKLAASSSDQHEVLFSRSGTQSWEAFNRELQSRHADGDPATLTLSAEYSVGDVRGHSTVSFRISSSHLREESLRWLGKPPFDMAQFIQAELHGGGQ